MHIGLCYLNIFIKCTLAQTIGILINSKQCRFYTKTLSRRKLDYVYLGYIGTHAHLPTVLKWDSRVKNCRLFF